MDPGPPINYFCRQKCSAPLPFTLCRPRSISQSLPVQRAGDGGGGRKAPLAAERLLVRSQRLNIDKMSIKWRGSPSAGSILSIGGPSLSAHKPRRIKGGVIATSEKTRETKREMVEVCPVCGSSELYYETGGYVGKVYHCKDCNYVGALVVEADDEMIKAIKEEFKREKGEKSEKGKKGE